MSVFPQFIVDSLPIYTVQIIKESKATIISNLKDLIKRKREELGNEEKNDLLSLLMNSDHDGEKIPEDLLIDESFTFLVAGHETTSSTISIIGYFLCSYPEIQEKLREEIMKDLKDKTTSISFEDIQKMKYLKQVVNECSRMMPAAPEVDKETNQEMFIDDFFIPKGTMIAINIYGLHHNPNVWENPEEFNPDRWNEENLKRIPNLRYNFIPFSVGSRDCVGKIFAENEVCLIVALLLKSFKLEFDGMKKEEVKFQFNVTMRPTNLKIKMKKI